MKKLAYYKLMGLVKRAAKILQPLFSPVLKQIGSTLKNYSALRRAVLRDTDARTLRQLLGGITYNTDMSPFIYQLGKSSPNIKDIARKALKEAKISLQQLQPLQITNLRKPQQLLGHLFQFQKKPTMLFDTLHVPDPTKMHSQTLWSAVDAVLRRFYGRGFTMPVNSSSPSTYRIYSKLPGVNLDAWKKARKLHRQGLMIDYKTTNKMLGNGVRMSNHFNPQGIWPYHNLVAPQYGQEGQPLFYNLQQTLRAMKQHKLLNKSIKVSYQQPTKQTLQTFKRSLTDNLGNDKGMSYYLDWLNGDKNTPFIS